MVINTLFITQNIIIKQVAVHYPQLIHNRCAKIEGRKWQKVAKSGCIIQKNSLILDCEFKAKNDDGFYRRF